MPAAAAPLASPAGRKAFVRRWSGFVAAAYVTAFAGTFAFSNFSSALKKVLGLNQKHLNQLSIAKDLGDSMGVVVGILSNYLPLPTLLCIGACVGVVGNGIQWLVVSRLIPAPPYWAVFVVSAMQGNTIPWMNTSVFTLSVRNFPQNRGPVVGLFKGFMGLSAAIYSTLDDTFFSSSPIMYLFMMMTIPPFFYLIMAIFCRHVPPSETAEEVKAEGQSLLASTLLAVALAVLLTVQKLVPALRVQVVMRVLVGVLFVMLAAQALVPVVMYIKIKRHVEQGVPLSIGGMVRVIENGTDSVETSKVDTKEEDGMREPLLGDAHILPSPEEVQKAPGSAIAEGVVVGKPTSSRVLEWASSLMLGEDWSTLSLFKTWHSYVLYLTLCCGAGMGLAFYNNLGQVGQSFGFEVVTVFVSLYSLGSFFGGMTSGNASEYFLKTMGTPRPAWLGLAKLLMIVGFVWLSTASTISLYIGSLLVGFSTGTHYSLCIPTISEFYGLKYFGTNFMVINTHLLLGSTIFSGGIAGYLYDKYGSYAEGETTLTCYGALCYGTTFKIFAGLLTLGLLLDALLSFISRPLYRKRLVRH